MTTYVSHPVVVGAPRIPALPQSNAVVSTSSFITKRLIVVLL